MSIRRTGSQNETGIPTRGKGVVQVHKEVLGLLVSSPLGETLKPPIVIGNKQDQQMSVMGLTNRPTQFAWTGKSKPFKKKNIRIKKIFIHFKAMLNILLFIASSVLFLALMCRQMKSFPEPDFPIKTPFGKLLFLDAIILYATVIMLVILVLRVVAD